MDMNRRDVRNISQGQIRAIIRTLNNHRCVGCFHDMAIVPISSGTSVPVQAPLLATAQPNWLPRHSQRGKNRTTQPAAQYAQYTPSIEWPVGFVSRPSASPSQTLPFFSSPPQVPAAAHPQAGLSRSPAPPPSFSAPSFPRCPQTSSLTSFPNLILSQSSSIDAIPQTTPRRFVVLRSRRDAP